MRLIILILGYFILIYYKQVNKNDVVYEVLLDNYKISLTTRTLTMSGRKPSGYLCDQEDTSCPYQTF
jgi:hypothetical protein